MSALLHREHGPDDVDDGVEVADFVQVYLLDRHPVNPAPPLRRAAERALALGSSCGREGRPVDEPADLREGVLVVRATGARCGAHANVRGPPVRVGVFVDRLLVSGAPGPLHDEPRGRHAGAQHRLGGDSNIRDTAKLPSAVGSSSSGSPASRNAPRIMSPEIPEKPSR